MRTGGGPSGDDAETRDGDAPYGGTMNEAWRDREMGGRVPSDAPWTGPPAYAGRGEAEVPGMYKDSIGYALWCLIFVGLGGVHRIYLGKYGTGILWLLTWGLFGIGQFVDLFRMRTLVRDSNVREGYLPHPRLATRWAPRAIPLPAEPEERRVMKALVAAAERNGGKLSVTQGVAATGLSFSEVEKVLREMVVEGYVDVDNEPHTGVVIYRFPELAG